jgi:hypothetical protein
VNHLIQHLIAQYREVQNGYLWMGGTYAKRFGELVEEEFFVRPLPDLHSVAEIISHLTLWRQETILKIETGQGSKTDQCEENWLPNEKLKSLGWGAIKEEYNRSLARIIELLTDKDDHFLNKKYYDTDFKDHYPYSFVLNGMLHHDLYHLGQIGIIIKYLKSTKNT